VELPGKIAIVTGSGGEGSGRAAALRLAAEGCHVIVSDINESGGRETQRLIALAGGRAEFFRCDVSVQDDVARLVAFAEEKCGGLDILVSNASGPGYRPGAAIEDSYDTVRIDLFGALYGVHFGVAAMKRRGGGTIVNISSTSALCHGSRHSKMPAYDIAKIGVLRLATTHAHLRETANIRVNCLIPDYVATPDVKSYWDALTPEQRKHSGAPPVLTTLDEIAQAIVALVRDDSLAGRALVMWSGQPPGLIAAEDRGYVALEPYSFNF
jgi:NAD(P)-dependent dehydrogenase (short-subunit alcohol dehydrogenase family)